MRRRKSNKKKLKQILALIVILIGIILAYFYNSEDIEKANTEKETVTYSN